MQTGECYTLYGPHSWHPFCQAILLAEAKSQPETGAMNVARTTANIRA